MATRRSWVPWTRGDGVIPGVDVTVSTTGLARGRSGTLRVVASAPSEVRLVIEQGTPAGALVEAPNVADAEIDVYPGGVRIETGPFRPGQVLDIALPVVPAFAGRFRTAPLRVRVVGGDHAVGAPLVWNVGGS